MVNGGRDRGSAYSQWNVLTHIAGSSPPLIVAHAPTTGARVLVTALDAARLDALHRKLQPFNRKKRTTPHTMAHTITPKSVP
jgi:DNA polymerase IIIc chi subunit